MSEKREKAKKAAAKAGKLLQHKHCQICYKAIPISEEFCSEACTEEFNQILKKRRNTQLLFYASMVILIFIMVIMLFGQ